MMRFILTYVIATASCFCYGQTRGVLVLPGDYADPSVTRIGGTYWATATTSNWSPIFPLLASKDLYEWELKGYVFNKPPAWADYYFWAPEINYDNGKVFVFYSAHKKGRNLCLAVATADRPEGPYRDIGPLVCQEAGSIDAFSVRDENGKLFLIWKEDGNSVKKPTPIWASELAEDRSKLIGSQHELFRNDTPWEANLVEGVSIIRHGEYFYAFYAGAGCCGRGCNYAMGVARSKKLLGPWEKYEKNPIQSDVDDWKCPGHGTPIEKDGKYYFLYHAYNKQGDVYVGRQGILNEFVFTADDWIELKTPVGSARPIPKETVDRFDGSSLNRSWQWSVFEYPDAKVKGGKLWLSPQADDEASFVARKLVHDDYEVDAKVISSPSAAGIALIGDDKNMIRCTLNGTQVVVSSLRDGIETVVEKRDVGKVKYIHLRMTVKDGSDITYSFSNDGSDYKTIAGGPSGHDLPPWDRATRVGLIVSGKKGKAASFDEFILRNLVKEN
jgi:xylan 1,4-beta-xylosidase